KRLERDALKKLHDDLEIPLSVVLTQMELCGVLVDPTPLAGIGAEMEKDMVALEKKAHEVVGHDFNLGSRKQLEAVLFDELGLKVSRRTKTGRSTDADALELIVGEHELPGIVLEHRG